MSSRTSAGSQSWKSWLALSVVFGVLTVLLFTSPFDGVGTGGPEPVETQATATQSETTTEYANGGDDGGTRLLPAWLSAAIEVITFLITVVSFGMSVVAFRAQRSAN